MEFTAATTGKKEKPVEITYHSQKDFLYIDVSYSFNHPKDHEIRKGLQDKGYKVAQDRGPSYSVTGGTPSELKHVKTELDIAYGLVEPIEDVALLSKIAIEIAIGASRSDSRRQRLTTENFPPGFDVIKASENDEFMRVCLETARTILLILK